MKRFAAVVVCAWLAVDPVASAGPRTGLVPKSWELDFEFDDPQRITIPAADGGSLTYWYVVYRVTNRAGEDVIFLPSFSLVTSTAQVVDAGENINPRVYDYIAARHKDQYPFFAPPAKVTGLLLQGEENSRASAAVFQQFDPKASNFRIYVSGLSGERVRVPNKAYDPAKSRHDPDNPQAFLLSRCLELVYDLPGDEETRAVSVPIRRSRNWVLR